MAVLEVIVIVTEIEFQDDIQKMIVMDQVVYQVIVIQWTDIDQTAKVDMVSMNID